MTHIPDSRTQPTLERCKAVLKRTGDARSTHYQKIKDGLFTRPVKLGARSVAWPSTDVDAIVNARIAGKADDEIRELVAMLEDSRANLAGGV